MKIKVFESTATAVFALVKAAEMILGQPLRMGQHTIDFDPDPHKSAKLVKINGTLLGCNPSQPVRIDVGGHLFVVLGNDSQWKPDGFQSVFYLNHPTARLNVFESKTYRFGWDDKAGHPKVIDDRGKASGLTCPKCGGPVRHAGQTEFKQGGTRPLLTDLFQCDGKPQCEHEITHADGKWPLEFIILDGQKHIVEPSASEFC